MAEPATKSQRPRTMTVFRGPGLLGPRTILVLVELLTGKGGRTTRDLVDMLGYDTRTSLALGHALSGLNSLLRKMEERGYVIAHREKRPCRRRYRGAMKSHQRDTLVWTLTLKGHREARALQPAVRALQKSKLGIAVIRGTSWSTGG